MSKQCEKIDESAKIVMKENEESWTKPIKNVPIAHFYKKFNKNTKK